MCFQTFSFNYFFIWMYLISYCMIEDPFRWKIFLLYVSRSRAPHILMSRSALSQPYKIIIENHMRDFNAFHHNHLQFDLRKMITVRLRSVVTKRGPENGRSWFHKSKLKAFATWRFYITLCCFGISGGKIQEEEEEDGVDDGGHGGVASWKHHLHAFTSATSAKSSGIQKVTSDDKREWGGHDTSTNCDVIYEQFLISWTIV